MINVFEKRTGCGLRIDKHFGLSFGSKRQYAHNENSVVRELSFANFTLKKQMSSALHVQIRHVERILPDEVASWLHHVAHELGEDVVGFVEFGDFYAQKRADV